MDVLKILEWASYGTSLIGFAGAIWFALTRWVKKEYRLSRNLTLPVYLVAEDANRSDMEKLQRLMVQGKGMLSKKQVHFVGTDIDSIPGKKAALVVFYYSDRQGHARNPLLEKMMIEKTSNSSTPLLIYTPDRGAVTEEDMAAINTKQAAISNYPLRLLSDIWATMCVLPVSQSA